MLVFHCRLGGKDSLDYNVRTHTLCIDKIITDKKTILLCTYAAARNSYMADGQVEEKDKFDKKMGLTIASGRLEKFKDIIETNNIEVSDSVYHIMPEIVAETFEHYISRAKRYFKCKSTDFVAIYHNRSKKVIDETKVEEKPYKVIKFKDIKDIWAKQFVLNT